MGMLTLLKMILEGLMQTARAFFKSYLKVHESPADSCLMVQRNKLGVVYMSLYVDDCYGLGHQKAVKEKMRDHLSYKNRSYQKKEKTCLGQPPLLKKLEKKFGGMVQAGQTNRTPGMPRIRIIHQKDGMRTVSEEDQMIMYHSGSGMLLYLVKDSCPDISNAVCDLSESIDEAHDQVCNCLKRMHNGGWQSSQTQIGQVRRIIGSVAQDT
jgi:hypothetical protein